MNQKKAHVTGIGGVFFKANDPKKLAAWYAEHLGFDVQRWGGVVFEARVDGKPAQTVWNPFSADTKYFAPSDKPFMLNLRVADLGAALADLRAKGANVLDRGEESEQGKFGYVVDPDGNLLELWEPAPE